MSENVTKGYLKKPIILQIINIVYFIIPLYYIVAYVMLCMRHPTVGQMVYNTIFFFGIMTVGSLFVAFSLYRTNQIGWYAVIIHSLLVITHNIYTLFSPAYKNPDGSNTNIILSVVFNIIMFAVILYFIVIHKKFRVLFFQPRLRWWESKPRYGFCIPAEITVNDVEYEISLSDVSVGGIRIVRDSKVPFDERFDYYINFKYEGIPVFSPIKLVWLSDQSAGAKFISDSQESRSNIHRIVKMLKAAKKDKEGR